MRVTTKFVLPNPLPKKIPDTPGFVDGEIAHSVLEHVASQLAAHLDQATARLRRLSILRDLSFEVAYGLHSGDPAAPSGNSEVLRRPHRFGLHPSAVSVAARIALERAIVVGRFGTKAPTKADVAALMLNSSMYMQVDTARELAGLKPDARKPGMGRISTRKIGSALEIQYEPEQFDFHGYQSMREGRVLDDDSNDRALIEAFRSGIPEEFRNLSEGMVQDLGFGIDDLIGSISYAIRLNRENGHSCLGVDLGHFRSMLRTQSPRSLAAFDYLTFSSEYLDASDLRPSSTRHQKRRIVTQPFMVHGDILILSREILFEALNRWLRYLLNGDWPAPVSRRKDWPSLDAAITARRNARGTKAFEPFVEAELDRLGLPWGATTGANREIGQAFITGEIDAIVVDASLGVLWVIEAKDVTSDQNLRSLQSELMKMTNVYWPQVSLAAVEVALDPGAVATHAVRGWARRDAVNADQLYSNVLEVDRVKDWQVRPLIVVRDRSAAEFLIGRTWAISTVSGLRNAIVGARVPIKTEGDVFFDGN